MSALLFLFLWPFWFLGGSHVDCGTLQGEWQQTYLGSEWREEDFKITKTANGYTSSIGSSSSDVIEIRQVDGQTKAYGYYKNYSDAKWVETPEQKEHNKRVEECRTNNGQF